MYDEYLDLDREELFLDEQILTMSITHLEEWANKLYQRYPNVDRVLINQVVARANDMHINNYEELENLLLQNIRRG